MGKYKVSRETTEKIRASRSRILDIPESMLPKGMESIEDFRKAMAEPERKVNPVRFIQKCTVAKTQIVDDTDRDGNPVDRWDLTLQVDEGEPINAGRYHMEFNRTRDIGEDGTMDKMTNFTLGYVDRIVKAALDGEYVLADDGDNDYDETFLEALPQCEVMVKFKVGTRYDKENKEWRADCDAEEFFPVE